MFSNQFHQGQRKTTLTQMGPPPIKYASQNRVEQSTFTAETNRRCGASVEATHTSTMPAWQVKRRLTSPLESNPLPSPLGDPDLPCRAPPAPCWRRGSASGETPAAGRACPTPAGDRHERTVETIQNQEDARQGKTTQGEPGSNRRLPNKTNKLASSPQAAWTCVWRGLRNIILGRAYLYAIASISGCFVVERRVGFRTHTLSPAAPLPYLPRAMNTIGCIKRGTRPTRSEGADTGPQPPLTSGTSSFSVFRFPVENLE